MEELICLQDELKQQLLKLKTNFKKCAKERITKSYVETRMQAIDLKWKNFNENHLQIITKGGKGQKLSYFSEDTYTEIEEFVLDFKAELQNHLEELNVGCSNKGKEECAETSNQANSVVRLPQICIPIFSGAYTEWLSFRDLFLSLIHNNTAIDKVQKLQYLKAHLVGEAAQLLIHMSITYDNYDQCWALLESRYNNKYFLANCILKDFFNQRDIPTESAMAIKQLLDSTTNTLHCLSNLGIDTSTWDIIIIYIVSMKLDKESRKQWEARVSEFTKCNTLATLGQFKDFLLNRFHALEYLEPIMSNSKPNFPMHKGNNYKDGGAVHAFHSYRTFCCFCNQNDHKISNCQEFVRLTSDNKRNFVQKNNGHFH